MKFNSIISRLMTPIVGTLDDRDPVRLIARLGPNQLRAISTSLSVRTYYGTGCWLQKMRSSSNASNKTEVIRLPRYARSRIEADPVFG